MGFGDGIAEKEKKDFTVQFLRPLGNSALTQVCLCDIEEVSKFCVEVEKVKMAVCLIFKLFYPSGCLSA